MKKKYIEPSIMVQSMVATTILADSEFDTPVTRRPTNDAPNSNPLTQPSDNQFSKSSAFDDWED